MSVKYVPVQWNMNKWVYDAVLLGAVVAYIWVFLQWGAPAAEFTRGPDGAILGMRAFGSCAFLMLTFILCIGPLARLDPRFLPVLYNRRHFGVMTFAVAFTHAAYVYNWYYNFIPTSRAEALISSNTAFGQLVGFPIEPLGIFALIVLAILATTSHDFWLSFLGAPIWKRLHLLIYPAYIALVAHVALGYLQDAKNPTFGLIFMGGAFAVGGLHLAAWLKDRHDKAAAGDWIEVCPISEIAENRARIVKVGPDERAAVFKYDGKLSAVSNACAHQNGPLGEGRIIDGCITCPWHGFQYRMADGKSPAPFTEEIPTYHLRVENGNILLNAKANPPGTHVEPLQLSEVMS